MAGGMIEVQGSMLDLGIGDRSRVEDRRGVRRSRLRALRDNLAAIMNIIDLPKKKV